MSGKNKCKILRQIRQQIASENDIPFVTAECQYQGECSGTCPRCEAELQYLENELKKRQRLGKAVAIAGIAATLAVSAVSCKQVVADKIEDLMSEYMYQGAISAPDLG